MKYNANAFTALALALLLFCFPAFSGLAESPADPLMDCFWEKKTENGPAGSFVSYPVLIGGESSEAQALAEKINGYMLETAQIPAYLQLLSTLQAGGTGLTMDYDMSNSYVLDETGEKLKCAPYVSLVFSAKGKMLLGRPSQVYYPMTLNMKTGETVAFEDLFIDPEGAKAFIETYLEEEVEPTLSTYLENNQLFPVPYDRFFLDGNGNLILYYENSQLSFLSGDSGAVAFRYSELWDWLDTSWSGIPMSVLDTPEEYLGGMTMKEQMDEFCMGGYPLWGFNMEVELGTSVEVLTNLYPQAADSEFYPGGACFELETAALRGTLILTDEAEDYVTGILSHRVDYFWIFTGKTTLTEAEALMGREPIARLNLDEAAAELYRVCPGT
ncbi:MAG: hypothetical protein IJJ60_13165, partial [Clostridia bacterium]|nr:hypothetical protein [Clostridia bacterium]